MADPSKHFYPIHECKIHTFSEGKCNKPRCDYRTAVTPQPWKPEEIHHVICISSLIAYKGLPQFNSVAHAIDAAYRGTDWCANQTPNMKWMPLKKTYLDNDPGGTKANPGPVWSLNLPCHNVDHNCAEGYTDEVTLELRRQIWESIAAGQEADPPQCLSPAEMQAVFSGIETDFQARIVTRGNRPVQGGAGTRAARMAEGTDRWWMPFSMANDMIAAARPVRAFGEKPKWARGFKRQRP